jgi:thiol:disulfide interchange protein
MEPKIESLAKGGGLALIKIDANKEIDVTLKHNVLSLPTLIFFRGDKEEKRLSSEEVTVDAVEKVCRNMREEK